MPKRGLGDSTVKLLYETARLQGTSLTAAVRALVEATGAAFVELHVATPLHECEARDRKGLYARARAGLIRQFTGVSDPYETPVNPEIVVDTSLLSASEAADRILAYLTAQGYLARGGQAEVEPARVKHDPITLWTSNAGMPRTLSPGKDATLPGDGIRRVGK